MEDKNTLPAGYKISKGPFCDGCLLFKPVVYDDETGHGCSGRGCPDQTVACENFFICNRSYELGRKERTV